MSNRYIPVNIRTSVIERAKNLCEYCLLQDSVAFFSFQIDHIISVKHGGKTILDNLAYSCIFCNRNKGSDLGSVLLPNLDLIRFYHPRIDTWKDHFRYVGATVKPKTNIGRVTIKILEMNHPGRIAERQLFIQAGVFPNKDALKIIK